MSDLTKRLEGQDKADYINNRCKEDRIKDLCAKIDKSRRDYVMSYTKFFSDNANITKMVIVLQSNDIDIYDEDFMIEALSFRNIDDLSDYVDMNGLLNVEFIGYYKAMQYLMREDFSLSESMEMAHDLGYETKDINSELLANLHASEKKREHFYNVVLEEIIDLMDEAYEEYIQEMNR